MMHRTMHSLSAVALILTLTACAGAPREDRPQDGEYEQISPFETGSDPFAATEDDALDRSHWPRLTFAPAAAGVADLSAYYGHIDRGADAADLRSHGTAEQRIAEALDDAEAGNWRGDNAWDAVAAPLRATGHTLMLPVKMLSR